jgi:serine O-acetyltransferase
MENNIFVKILLKYHKGSHIKTKTRLFFPNIIIQIKYGGYIPKSAKFGDNIFLPHGFNCIFISGKAKIGNGCIFNQNVTFGSDEVGAPLISYGCLIGAIVIVIRKILIEKGSKIGGRSVIHNDIPDYSMVLPQKFSFIIRCER